MCWGHLPQKGKRGCHFLGVQSTNVKTDTVIKAAFPYFVGLWWRFVLQHHSRLSLEAVSQPLACAPHIPAGMLAGGSTAWTYLLGSWCGHTGPYLACPCPAGTRWHPDIPATTCPCSASGGGGGTRQPPCISSMSRSHLICSWRGLSWGHKVCASHQLSPGWLFHHIFLSLTVRS